MPHFFIPPENIVNGRFVLSGEEAHHLLNVRRCTPGTTLRVFDGTGKSYLARVEHVTKTELSGVIIGEEEAVPVVTPLHLFQAVPKGDRFDWLVEKAAELGVKSIIPLITERSVIKEISTQKLERWRRLSKAASQQCGRTDVMAVEDPRTLRQAVEGITGTALNLIPWESEDTKTVAAAFIEGGTARTINVFIGPEGGFSQQEISAAQEKGVVPVTLGPRILRTETAGLLSSILVLELAGEFGR